MGQITQGNYTKSVDEVMPAYSQSQVVSADTQIFTGSGYLHGIAMNAVSTGVGNGTVSIYDGTSTGDTVKVYLECDVSKEGLASKVLNFTAPLRFSSGMLADVTNAKVNAFYRK